MGAIAIGIGAGALCYFAVRLRAKIGLDDSLDVVGVHGVGGTWGAIATGIFCVASVTNPAGADGLLAAAASTSSATNLSPLARPWGTPSS